MVASTRLASSGNLRRPHRQWRPLRRLTRLTRLRRTNEPTQFKSGPSMDKEGALYRRFIHRATTNFRFLRGAAAEGRGEPDGAWPFAINPAQPGQSYTSVCSANSKASSTSMPR